MAIIREERIGGQRLILGDNREIIPTLGRFDAVVILRRRALDLIRRDSSTGSLSIKLKRAGWDEVFLRSLLSGVTQE